MWIYVAFSSWISSHYLPFKSKDGIFAYWLTVGIRLDTQKLTQIASHGTIVYSPTWKPIEIKPFHVGIYTIPLDPKTMKKCRFSSLEIWVMTRKIEGCGFPWYMDGKAQDAMDRVISGKWPICLGNSPSATATFTTRLLAEVQLSLFGSSFSNITHTVNIYRHIWGCFQK